MNEIESAPSPVYHYCSVGALRGIITSRQFRLSNVFFMNDYMEVEWFKEVCRTVLDERHDEITKTTTKWDIPPTVSADGGVTSSASYRVSVPHSDYHSHLRRWLNRRAFDHVYCGCFSQVQDDLSQWRGYAHDGAGVAIGFDLNAILAANENVPWLEWNIVEYNEREQSELATEIVLDGAGKIVSTDKVSGMKRAAMTNASLRSLAPRFKNPKFKSEKEVRLIAQHSQTSNFEDNAIYEQDALDNMPSDVDFYERDGKLIPFVTVKVPAESVKEVWLGPRSGDDLDASAIKLFLSRHGVNVKDTIHRSAASYR